MAAPVLESLLAQVLNLSDEERGTLATRLLQSLEPDEEPLSPDEWRKAWMDELSMRLRDYRAGGVVPIAAEKVLREARERSQSGSAVGMSADDIIALLALEPHPEGGHYRETWRDRSGDGRGTGTAIYFLLRGSDAHRWHRVDAVEIWHHYAGAPLELAIASEGGVVRHVLGTDLSAGQRPQIAVPARCWQRARCLGDHTLVGCTVSPAFVFEGFELAAPGWEPLETM